MKGSGSTLLHICSDSTQAGQRVPSQKGCLRREPYLTLKPYFTIHNPWAETKLYATFDQPFKAFPSNWCTCFPLVQNHIAIRPAARLSGTHQPLWSKELSFLRGPIRDTNGKAFGCSAICTPTFHKLLRN